MRVNFYVFLLLAASLTFLPSGAYGQNDVVFDPVVVSARGYATSLTQTPGGAALVECEDFARSTSVNIADVLANVPGISATGDSPWGQDISIRGLTGTSIVVLMDGKRINTATDINARLGLINMKDVDRIEILKGPVSSLYGSGSIGGVVNIITRKAGFSRETGIHGRLSQTGSSNPKGYDGYGNVRFQSERFWLFGAGSYRKFSDIAAGNGVTIPNSQFSDNQGRIAAGLKLTKDFTVEMQALRLEADDVGIPGGPSTLPSAARVAYPKTTNELVSLDTITRNIGPYLEELQTSFYYNYIKRRVLVDRIPTGAVREISPEANHETIGGKVQGIFQAGSHHIVSGLDGWTWSIKSDRYRFLNNGQTLNDVPVPDARQTSAGFFAEDDWKLHDRLTLNLGARLDYIRTTNDKGNGLPRGDENDTGWNLHAGLTWKMAPAWSQSFIAASSYRAADILERFKYINLSGGQILTGNPKLSPENSRYGEYALHYRGNSFRGDIRLFFNEIHDYIGEKRISPTLLTMSNTGKARIYGGELEGRRSIGDNWSIFATVTALKGRDESKNEPLRGIAPISGTAGIEYSLKNWWARLDTRWAARQSDTPDDMEHTPGYVVLNASSGFKFKALGLKQEVILALGNIFDYRYQNYLANSRGITLYEQGFAAMLTHNVEF